MGVEQVRHGAAAQQREVMFPRGIPILQTGEEADGPRAAPPGAGAAVRKADEDLKTAIDRALTELAESGKLTEVFARWLERAGVWQLSFNTNAMTMAFNEGRRNEGLALTNKLMVSCPEQWAQMMLENSDQGERTR